MDDFLGRSNYGEDVKDILIKSYKKPVETIKLTAREKEILIHLSNGLTTPEIAERLFIAPYTVGTHRKNLLSKCGQKTSAGLIRFALKYKLL